MVAISTKERRVLLPQIHDPSYKATFLRSLTAILYINEYEQLRKNKNIYIICKEYFMSVPVVIFARKNFYLLDAINKKISVIQAAGLIEYWHSRGADNRFLKAETPPVSKTLTWQHLSGSFILLTGGYFVAFAAFVIEIAYKTVQSKLRGDKVENI